MLLSIKKLLLTSINYARDLYTYLLFSGTLNQGRDIVMRSNIVRHAHSIEKGLALPAPRPGFGKEVVTKLLIELAAYLEKNEMDEMIRSAINILSEYVQFNKENNVDVTWMLDDMQKLQTANNVDNHDSDGGCIWLKKVDADDQAYSSFEKFFSERYSVRTFSKESVSGDEIMRIAGICQKTPSVCNRQPWRVHFYDSESDIKKLLSYQHGNRGFGHEIPGLVIVSCELGAFTGSKERNQAYIDGGMYSMSFLLALHSLGYVSCCLNLSLNNDEATKLRIAGSIPKSEVVIMMIAVGRPLEEYAVAFSQRMHINKMVTVHGGSNKMDFE
jgi:nitroreductase